MNKEEQTEQESVRTGKKSWIFLVILLVFLAGGIVIATQFKIETIQVTGNIHYTDEEIIQLVAGEDYSQNTLLLYLKHKLQPAEPIPFIEKIDVEYISSHVVTITVYEKAMAGCVRFMNEYMYFDKDGVVLESSSQKMPDIPCITGIHFDTMVMYEPLPIEDKDFFLMILTLTQLLQKYEIPVDDVRFTSQEEIILYYQDIQVLLGDGSNIEEQISQLGNILQSIEGKSGTLYMKDYTIEKGEVIFRENN